MGESQTRPNSRAGQAGLQGKEEASTGLRGLGLPVMLSSLCVTEMKQRRCFHRIVRIKRGKPNAVMFPGIKESCPSGRFRWGVLSCQGRML